MAPKPSKYEEGDGDAVVPIRPPTRMDDGAGGAVEDAAPAATAAAASPTGGRGESRGRRRPRRASSLSYTDLVYGGVGRPALQDWGYPGFLSPEEFRVFDRFRDEVFRRGEAFRSAVFSFDRADEEEAYALCRWLRARKFVLADVMQMVEEAAVRRSDAEGHDFFPDPHRALGVEACIYHSQYPQFYYSFAKGGYPLFISKVGVFSAAGLECVTTAQGILNFHWYDMMHDYVRQLRRHARSNPDFKRYETVAVMDLNHLHSSQLTKRALNIVKVQSEVDSLCFPETLHRLVIVNAPGFFAMTWRVIKNWVDERTASKVIIMGTNKSKWTRKLRELVDEKNLPSDYGGTGESTEAFMERKTVEQYEEIALARRREQPSKDSAADPFLGPSDAKGEKVAGQRVHLFAVRSHASHSVSLMPGESMRMSVFTRSTSGGTLHVTCPNGRKLLPQSAAVRHAGLGIDEELPTRTDLDLVLRGAGRYKIRMDSNSGPFSVEHFLFVGRVFVAGAVSELATLDVAVGAVNSSDNESVMGDAVSLCDQLCYDEAIRKDSEVMNPVLNGGTVVISSTSDRPPSPLNEPDENVSAVPSRESAPEKRHDQTATTQQKTEANGAKANATVAAAPSAAVPSAVVTPEEEHVPATGIMCGVFAPVSLSDFFSKLWCAPASKQLG